MKKFLNASEVELFDKEVNIFNDAATKSKIRKHLLDINDVITEDDIRNIRVSLPGAEAIWNPSGFTREKQFSA